MLLFYCYYVLSLLLLLLNSFTYCSHYLLYLQKLQLANSTLHMENWWRTNETVFFNIYLYNYSNKQLSQGELVGPYVYQLIEEKIPILTTNLTNNLIQYQQFDHLSFLTDESKGFTPQDTIITVSLPFIYVKNLLQMTNSSEEKKFIQNALNDTGQNAYEITNVEKLLFTGRRSKLMSIIKRNDNINVNGLLPYDRKRVTNFTINSGTIEGKLIASINSIDGQSIDTEGVRDGHQYNHLVRKSQLLKFFEPSLCIYGHLIHNSTKEKNENTIYDFMLRSNETDKEWPSSNLVNCKNDLPISYSVNPYSSHFEIEPVSNLNV